MIGSIAGSIANAVNKGVPGIPLGALDAIADENTRLVLQAIVDGWHVRNAASGSGDAAFVTRAEIDGLVSTKTKDAVQNLGGSMVSTGDLSSAMSDLYTQVFESQLYKSLAAKVDLIERPGGIFTRLNTNELALINETKQRLDGDTGLSTSISAMGTRIGSAEAAILTETVQRVNSDNALQTTVTTQYAAVNQSLALQQQSITTNANAVAAITTQLNQIQAQVGENSAAIALEQQVRATADGELYAQYTLRLDVNGYVSGFGLANDGKVSDFIVRTDRFSIVSPTGNKAAVIMQNNTINVFDENGALRVKLGRLS